MIWKAETALLLALLTSACGEDEPNAPSVVDGFDPRLRGIYALERHSSNTDSCEPAGEAVPDAEPLFAIDTVDFHGSYLLAALSCTDGPTCRSHLAAAQAPRAGDEIPELDVTFFFLFNTSKSDGSASSLSEASTLEADGSCSGYLFADQLTHANGQVRIESRITRVPMFLPGSAGECTLPAGARDNPCNGFELVTGVWAQAL